MSGTAVVLVGAAWGTIGAVALVAVGLQDAGPELRFEPLDAAALAVTAVGPYALSLLAFRAQPTARVGVWLSSGLAGALIAATALSVSTLVLLPAGILLLVGGAIAMADARPMWLAVSMAVIVLVAAGGAFLARFAGEDPRCWRLTRTPNGPVWVEDAVDPGPGMGQTLGNRDLRGECTSDVTTPSEAAVVLGLWAALGLVVAISGRGRRDHMPEKAAA
jgi:hypothetical protein